MRSFTLVVGVIVIAGSILDCERANAQDTDGSQVKFLMRTCSKGTMWSNDAVFRRVIGTVATDVDLSQDSTAGALLLQAAGFAQEKCPSPYGFVDIVVYLRPGSPSAFADYSQGFEFVPRNYLGVVRSMPPDVVTARTTDSRQRQRVDRLAWRRIYNGVKASRDLRIAEERQARDREAALEQERQAAQKQQADVAARSTAFVEANRVMHFVTAEQLTINPFVYQGQIVAVYGIFERMNSATQGLFTVRGGAMFVVSDVPTSRFTQQRTMVMLAARVSGNIEIQVPGRGPTLVPHLSLVGSAFCQETECRDYAIRVR